MTDFFISYTGADQAWAEWIGWVLEDGDLLDSQGDLSGARPYYERALAIFDSRLGPDHPNTKVVRDNLAALGPPPGGESPDTPEAQG